MPSARRFPAFSSSARRAVGAAATLAPFLSRSALAKVTVNVWSLHPYHLICQPAVLADPLADIRWICVPQLLGGKVGGGPMESEIGAWRHADVLARNVANKHGACRYARTDNSDVYRTCGKRRPLHLMGTEQATMIVGDVNGFRSRD
jgi:hypothetical protein